MINNPKHTLKLIKGWLDVKVSIMSCSAYRPHLNPIENIDRGTDRQIHKPKLFNIGEETERLININSGGRKNPK